MRFVFDTQAAIAAAWDFLWRKNLEERVKSNDQYFRNPTYYLCAADLEYQVRAWAQDTADGQPWRQEKGYPGDFCKVKFRGNLKGTVRAWLLSQVQTGKLEVHNFDRGHISGARFRPKGQPLGPSEKETIERKERNKGRPKVRHFGKSFESRPACSIARAQKAGRRIFGFRPTRSWTTSKAEEVTCPQCLNLMKSKHAETGT